LRFFTTWTPRERVLTAVCAASMSLSILAVAGLGGGVSQARPTRLVHANEIANGAITTAKIKNGTVSSADIENGGVRPVDLASGLGSNESFYFTESSPVSVPAGTNASAQAPCHNGDEAIAGGYKMLGQSTDIVITEDQPSNQASGWFWSAGAENNGSSGSVKIIAIASCAHYES
jgi:hypothetical protein